MAWESVPNAPSQSAASFSKLSSFAAWQVSALLPARGNAIDLGRILVLLLNTILGVVKVHSTCMRSVCCITDKSNSTHSITSSIPSALILPVIDFKSLASIKPSPLVTRTILRVYCNFLQWLEIIWMATTSADTAGRASARAQAHGVATDHLHCRYCLAAAGSAMSAARASGSYAKGQNRDVYGVMATYWPSGCKIEMF